MHDLPTTTRGQYYPQTIPFLDRQNLALTSFQAGRYGDPPTEQFWDPETGSLEDPSIRLGVETIWVHMRLQAGRAGQASKPGRMLV